jgi:protease-4
MGRESIFASTFRALFIAFGALIGIFLAIFIALLTISALSDSVDMPTKSSLTVSADANGKRKLLVSSTPVILRMDLHGVIGEFSLTEEKWNTMLLDSREGTLDKDRVKGIVLHINTPGGLATDSSAIYRLLKAYKEKYHVPIYAYVDGICASGGMYIASAADKIYSSSDSIIGSVGVRMGPAFNVSDVMATIGVKALTLTEGKDKDLLNPFRPWKEGEEGPLKDIMAKEYEQFVDVVAAARPRLSRDELVNTYGARVYVAPDAQTLGYIDLAESSYTDCLKALVAAAGIEENHEYQVIAISPSFSFFRDMMQSQSGLLKGKIQHIFPIGPGISSEMSGKLLFLYQPT